MQDLIHESNIYTLIVNWMKQFNTKLGGLNYNKDNMQKCTCTVSAINGLIMFRGNSDTYHYHILVLSHFLYS